MDNYIILVENRTSDVRNHLGSCRVGVECGGGRGQDNLMVSSI